MTSSLSRITSVHLTSRQWCTAQRWVATTHGSDSQLHKVMVNTDQATEGHIGDYSKDESIKTLPFAHAKLGPFHQERPELKNQFSQDSLLKSYIHRHVGKEVSIFIKIFVCVDNQLPFSNSTEIFNET